MVPENLVEQKFENLLEINNDDDAKVLLDILATRRKLSTRAIQKFKEGSTIYSQALTQGDLECDIPMYFYGDTSQAAPNNLKYPKALTTKLDELVDFNKGENTLKLWR